MQPRVISIGPNAGKLPLSPAIGVGPFVFVSGQGAVDLETNRFIGGDAAAQTHQVIKNLPAVLVQAGSSLDRVVKATAFLPDIEEFPAFKDVYRSYFFSDAPATTTVQIARLVGSYSVEIDVVAFIGDRGE